MSVVKGERKESKVEFEEAYFRIYEDCMNLTKLNFGCKNPDEYAEYIKTMSNEILVTVCNIGRNIRIANSIFPICKLEYETRRLSQDKAIGLCFDLLTKYQLIMRFLKVRDDKFIEEIKHIRHEINCIKSWRSSDNTRFKNLG